MLEKSTKKLRPQAHITQLFEEGVRDFQRDSKWFAISASAIETTAETVLSGAKKVISELLQNADDASEDETNEVTFQLRGDFLIFSHVGRHFSCQDVEKLCDFGRQNIEKSTDSEKTGFKDIGFKSLFSIADCVYVISNEYSFRFDKNHPAWKLRSDETPWQVIPILTSHEDIPDAAASCLDPARVSFVLALKDPAKIKENLNLAVSNPRMLLFLRHVNALSFITEKSHLSLSVETERRPDQVCIKTIFAQVGDGEESSPRFHSAWHMKTVEFAVPLRVRAQLKDSSAKVTPQKIKEAEKTSLTFAAAMQEDGEIISLTDAELFCYLPTQVRCGFPYLLNASFLLSADRTQLLEDNPWNAFLFQMIASRQLAWLQLLAQDPETRAYVLRLAGPKKLTHPYLDATLSQAYSKCYEAALLKVAFVPYYRDPRVLLTAAQCIFDKTHFFAKFGDKVEDADERNIADYQLLDVEKFLMRLGYAQSFYETRHTLTLGNLAPRLKAYCEQNNTADFNARLILFLKQRYEKEPKHYPTLSNHAFVLTALGEIYSPETLYFPSDTGALPVSLDVPLLNPALYENVTIREWLAKLGMKAVSPQQFIHDILSHVHTRRVNCEAWQQTPDQALQITRYLFHHLRDEKSRQTLSSTQKHALENLPVLTTAGRFVAASACYLANVYKPRLAMQSKITDEDKARYLFVSRKYIENAGDTAAWKEFFIFCGAKEKMSYAVVAHWYPDKSVAQQAYREYAQKHAVKANREIGSGGGGAHYVRNFLQIDFIEYLTDAHCAAHFWTMITRDWNKISQVDTVYGKEGSKRYSGASSPVPSFLSYYLRTFPCMRAVGVADTLYRATELYIPALRVFAGEDFPVAEIDIELTEEQAAFFGFKTQLCFQDLLQLLTTVTKDLSHPPSPKRLAEVLRLLLKLKQEGRMTEAEQAALNRWEGNLLAQNNTLQPVRRLCYFGIEGVPAPAFSPQWLQTLPGLTSTELTEICAFFAIRIVTKENMSVYPVGTKLDLGPVDAVRAKLALLTMIEGVSDPENIDAILKRNFQRLNILQTYAVIEVEIRWDVDSPAFKVPLYLHENQLYFKIYNGRSWEASPKKADLLNMLSDYVGFSPFIKTNMAMFLDLDDDELDAWLIDESFALSAMVRKEFSAELNRKLKTLQVEENDFSVEILAKIPAKNGKEAAGEVVLASASVVATLALVSAPLPILIPECTATSSERAAFATLSTASAPPREFFPMVATQELDFRRGRFSDAPIHPIHFPEKASAAPAEKTLTQRAVVAVLPVRAAVSVAPAATFYPPTATASVENSFSGESIRQIGRWGEEFVYRELQDYYEKKYADRCVLTETPQGFIIEGTPRDMPLRLEVIWYNKDRPDVSGSEACDIEIIKNGVSRYVEVKATLSDKKEKVELSQNECEIMFRYKDRYRLYRVYSVGTPEARIERYVNPAQAIFDGELLANKVTLRV